MPEPRRPAEESGAAQSPVDETPNAFDQAASSSGSPATLGSSSAGEPVGGSSVPAYGQPPYQPAQQWGQPASGWAQPTSYEYGSSVLAIIAGLVLVVCGIPVLLFGGVAILGGPFLNQLTPADTGQTQGVIESVRGVSFFAVVILVIGILHLLSGIFIWAHRSWARWLGILISGLFVLLGVLGLVSSLGLQTSVVNGQTITVQNALVVPLLIVVVYGIALIGPIVGGEHFRKRPIG